MSKYTDIPITDIQLNLSKNQLQPAYWKDVNAYAFDNMLQPISKVDYGYKQNFAIGDNLYSIDGKKIYRDGVLLKDYTNCYLTNTVETDGYKKGNYTLSTNNKLYYRGTSILDADYKSSSLWVHSKLDKAILLCSKGLYFISGSSAVAEQIDEFDFANCVQVETDTDLCLFESTSSWENKILSTYVYVNYITTASPNSVLKFTLSSTYPIINIEPGANCSGGGTAVNLGAASVTSENQIEYKITANKNNPAKFRVFPTSWKQASIVSSFSIVYSGSPGDDSIGYVQLNKYAEYSVGNTTPSYKTIELWNNGTIISEPNTSSVVYVSKPITLSSVSYIDYNNGVYGIKLVTKVYSSASSSYSDQPVYVYFDTNTFDNVTTGAAIKNKVISYPTECVSLVNTLSKASNGSFSFYYSTDTLNFITYDDRLLAIPYTIDDYYIVEDNEIQLYSSTINKTFDITIDADNELTVTKIGDELVTNSLTDTYVFGKNNDFSPAVFDAKYAGFTAKYFIDLPESLGNGFIATVSDDVYNGATEFYISTYNTDLVKDGFDMTGECDVYIGQSGTVAYTYSSKDGFVYGKNIEKEYGVSEEAQYTIPVTDSIKVLLDYDIYNTFIKILGYTIQLSVVDNEIQSVITLASIDGDTECIFTLQGQGYQIIKGKIYSFISSGENGLSDQQFITLCPFEYIGYDDTVAYFWDKLTKNIICFQGNNQMSTLQSMSLLDDIVFSSYDVAHQMLVLSTIDKTYVKLYNNWMSFDFPTTTSTVIFNDELLLDNNMMLLDGAGTLNVQTGWIYNNVANQPLMNIESIFIGLLESAKNVDVTVEFMSADKAITTMSKSYSNVEYVKITPTVLLTKAFRIRIESDAAVTGITVCTDEKTKDSPISGKQFVEI